MGEAGALSRFPFHLSSFPTETPDTQANRKVSAKAWNSISFIKRNLVTNEISFWNIPAAFPVLLDMVERPDKTFSIDFSTGFSENLSTWKTTTPLTAILEKHAIEGHVHLLLKCFEETRLMVISFS